eukprot:3823699-Prorocentrum_lima.AAC.1
MSGSRSLALGGGPGSSRRFTLAAALPFGSHDLHPADDGVGMPRRSRLGSALLSAAGSRH